MEDSYEESGQWQAGEQVSKAESLAGLSSTQTSNSDLPLRRDIFLHLEVLDGTQHKVG